MNASTFVILFLGIFFPVNAYAYVDPGSGSYMLQLLLAFLFGAIASIKIFWSKIKTFLGNMLHGSKKASKDED